MKLIIATHNQDKALELIESFSGQGITIYTLNDFPEIGEIVEDGNSLEENALIKARTAYRYTGIASIGDDSGLFVDALNGEPGIFSARYAGEICTYADNINKLLNEMSAVCVEDRAAKFITAMSYVDNKTELTVEGSVQGSILNSPKGNGGFGYDAIFYIKEREKTFAEMTLDEKNKISHRAKAITNMIKLLQSRYPEIFSKMEDIA